MPASSAVDMALGFEAPVAASHAVYRKVLEAMSRPGRVVECGVGLVPPAPLKPAAAAIMLALLDAETPLWIAGGSGEIQAYLQFHTGCPLVKEAQDAMFALIATPAALSPLSDFQHGSDTYPDLGCTLIIEAPEFGGKPLTAKGPGINGSTPFPRCGMPESFWSERRSLEALFPRGVDLFFTHDEKLAALPRSTRLED
jgi:alpha-D-ribose 1-methylphosphonate 5-triphosphate synthase subunit PhnH